MAVAPQSTLEDPQPQHCRWPYKLPTWPLSFMPAIRAALSCCAARRQDATVPVRCSRRGSTTRFFMLVSRVIAHQICRGGSNDR